MKEIRIEKVTLEEFKGKFKEVNMDKIKSYALGDLNKIFENSIEVSYFLIGDRIYSPLEKREGLKELTKEDIEIIENLNEEFRDSLISLREFLYNGRGALESKEAMEIQAFMNLKIKEGKNILLKYEELSKEDLKKSSKKYFMPDFLQGIFGEEDYSFEKEVEIDCGL